MIYVKSFLAGLAALILAALLGIVVLFARVEMLSSREGIGVVVGPGWPLVAISLLAFAAAFFWQYRRIR
jgi:uncharacterized membrane protein YqgA involved in biofilm formation